MNLAQAVRTQAHKGKEDRQVQKVLTARAEVLKSGRRYYQINSKYLQPPKAASEYDQAGQGKMWTSHGDHLYHWAL